MPFFDIAPTPIKFSLTVLNGFVILIMPIRRTHRLKPDAQLIGLTFSKARE